MRRNSKVFFAFLSFTPPRAPALFLGPVLFLPSHLSRGFLAPRPRHPRPGHVSLHSTRFPLSIHVDVVIVVTTLAANSMVIAVICPLLTELYLTDF